MIGLGTAINVVAVLAGSSLGVLFGGRLPERTTRTITDALGLTTLVIGGLNVLSLTDPAYVAAVGNGFTLIVVLMSLLIGGIAGSLARIEARLEGVGGWIQARAGGGSGGEGAASARARFIEGFVDASLIFCVGPMTILGSISDGLGRGIDQLVLKSILDLFASIAFAASLGWGVAASALSVATIQGTITLLAVALGGLLPAAAIAGLTATGGILLLGVGLRLLRIREVPVADLLPALVVAPVLTVLVAGLR